MNGFAARDTTLLLAAIAVVGATLVTCGSSGGPVDGARARAHVAKMVGFGPRPAGSDALRATGDYLMEQIRALGLTPRAQEWEQSVDAYGKTRKLALRNVWTEIPGKDPEKGPILMLAAHYDTKLCEGHPDPAHNFPFVGAIDGAGASAVLLELARALQEQRKATGPKPYNVWLVWFDGEECVEYDWTDEKSLLGSRHFAETMDADKQLFPRGLAERLRVMVLLDLIGARDIKIDKDTRSSTQLLDIFAAAAEAMGESDRMFRYLSPMVDDHVPFKRFGVAVIDLIDFKWRAPADWELSAEEWQRRGVTRPADGAYAVWWHTADDTLDQVSADSLAFAGNLVWRALPAIEKSFYAK